MKKNQSQINIVSIRIEMMRVASKRSHCITTIRVKRKKKLNDKNSLILENRAKIIRIPLFNLAHRSRLRKNRKHEKKSITNKYRSVRIEMMRVARDNHYNSSRKRKKKLNNDKNSILENRARIIKINPKLIVEFVSLYLTLRKNRKPMKSLKKINHK